MKTQNFAQWTQREMETIISSVARYTRFVRSTKMILVILVSLLTSIMAFYFVSKNDDAGIRIAINANAGASGAPPPTQMKNARYHGLDKNNQPYNMIAVTASQRDADTMDLKQVSSDISLASGRWLSLSADNGVFFSKTKLMDLSGNIEMFDDQGYEFRTEHLHLNIDKKTATTIDPVKGQGPMGTLNAVGADMDGVTGIMEFHGPVFVTLYPAAQDASSPATAKPTQDRHS